MRAEPSCHLGDFAVLGRRCYAFWMLGVLLDHYCMCAMAEDDGRCRGGSALIGGGPGNERVRLSVDRWESAEESWRFILLAEELY